MIQILLGLFGAVGFVVKFIKGLLVKYVGHALILSAQFSITAITITFVVAFYLFTITALVSVYNLAIDILNYATTSTNGLLSCLFGMMNCAGVIPALQNGITLFYGVLVTIVLFHLMKFTFSAMKIIGNELFKLGLLLGQALN
ncbi:MAG: hypothetical protein RBT59_09905 [Arcobacteraceae bacterium]|jgi:hypothetical protein|nr:hypothetical protein [Arcobacteraceae bacterium]